jgi:cytochrome b involved in lipid metabolism
MARYFTPAEVAAHNCESDLWVSYLGGVYDLTALAKANQGNLLMKPILTAAGTDISHWFNSKTSDVRDDSY